MNVTQTTMCHVLLYDQLLKFDVFATLTAVACSGSADALQCMLEEHLLPYGK